MSERKTAEIKFRCTPSFKASLAAAAQAAEKSMSEYLESAVWALENAKMDGTRLIDNAIAELQDIGAGESGAVAALEAHAENPFEDGSKILACSRNCKPWEFCACKAGE